MKVVIVIVAILIVVMIIGTQVEDSSNDVPSASTATRPTASASRPTASCAVGSPVSGLFYPEGEGINFRTGPGTEYDQVINRRATEVLGRTQYRTLYPSNTLEGRCETEGWLQGKIIASDGSSVSWETGWVSKDFIRGNQTPDQLTGLLWNIESEDDFSEAEKSIVREGALKVLSDEPNCESIYDGYRSDSREGAFYVTCNARNGGLPFNVWFTPDELEADADLRVPEAFSESASRTGCDAAIRESVTNPSTLEIHSVLGYATEVHNNGNRTIIQEFTAANAFGVSQRYSARCLIQPNGNLEISIQDAQ